MADVITNSRIVISGPVVVEASLVVLILSYLSERNELPAAVKVAKVTVDVIVCLLDNVTFIIVCLDRTADVVADDGVVFPVLYLVTIIEYILLNVTHILHLLFSFHL